MPRLFIAVTTFIAVAACAPPAAITDAPRTIPFRAALEPPFSDSALLSGEVTILPDRLEIVLHRLDYVIRNRTGTRPPDSLKVALATGVQQARWDREAESAAVPFLDASRTINDARSPLRFVIARPPGRTLGRRWLTFLFTLHHPAREGEPALDGYYFAHTNARLFEAP